jgi:hypothetical protein
MKKKEKIEEDKSGVSSRTGCLWRYLVVTVAKGEAHGEQQGDNARATEEVMTGQSLFLKLKDPQGENRIDRFLAQERALSAKGRLIFALDATGSRKATWDLASSLTAEMFREAALIGGLETQLVYYRGIDECRSSLWVANAGRLLGMMQRIQCQAGMTQIGRVLDHAAKESALQPVGALVFIGDAMEESPNELVGKARTLKTPCFMFQEGDDELAKRTFEDIARSTGGAYGRFEPSAGKRLGELLRAVAAFAAGGIRALEGRTDEASRLLLGQVK